MVKYITKISTLNIIKLLRQPDPKSSKGSGDPEMWQQVAEVMTPSIVKVVEFAKQVPGFTQVFSIATFAEYIHNDE